VKKRIRRGREGGKKERRGREGEEGKRIVFKNIFLLLYALWHSFEYITYLQLKGGRQ